VAASFPLPTVPQNVQQLGSLLTYLRRYTLVAMLGIAAGEDDDGQHASERDRREETAPTPPGDAGAESRSEDSPFQPPALGTGPAEEDLTSKQRSKIFAIRTKLIDAGVFDDDGFRGQLLLSFGVDSVSGLTKSQASELITRLLAAEEKLDEG
jgi:hypothetical protein